MSLPASYFDQLYAKSEDPWGFKTRWYERRKYALTVASLPRERYRRGFEPGCSNGTLTAMLATRCDSLLATDIAAAAVVTAARDLASLKHVEVRRMAVPDEWPTGEFDLIVLSEVGYYLSREALAVLVRQAARSLSRDGTVIAVHWRHGVADYPLGGDAVHSAITADGELVGLVHHEESDFLLDVFGWQDSKTVAEREGLVGTRGRQ